MNTKYRSLLLALLVMLLWGSLFPCIKLGYDALDIDSSCIADLFMFAAIRFLLCGMLVCAFCLFKKKSIPTPSAGSVVHIILVGVFAIVLHYACTYIGLAASDSSKTALLKQTGALIYICFSFLFFKDEKFSIYKIIGAVVGFCGIVAINLSSGKVTFSPGDIWILGASVCTVVSNIISRQSAQNSSPFWITGISQLSGGLILFMLSWLMGGRLPHFTVSGTLIFLYICAASVSGYTLWYYILRTNGLSGLFIIKFTEPLFACIFGAVLLSENILKTQYLIAFVLISSGIVIGHHKGKEKIIQ